MLIKRGREDPEIYQISIIFKKEITI